MAEKLVIMVTHGVGHPSTSPSHSSWPSPRWRPTSKLSSASRQTASRWRSRAAPTRSPPRAFRRFPSCWPTTPSSAASSCSAVPASNHAIEAADLLENSEVVAAARIVAEVTSATNALVY